MKKIYQTPRIETIQILGKSTIMVGSPTGFILGPGGSTAPGGND